MMFDQPQTLAAQASAANPRAGTVATVEADTVAGDVVAKADTVAGEAVANESDTAAGEVVTTTPATSGSGGGDPAVGNAHQPGGVV